MGTVAKCRVSNALPDLLQKLSENPDYKNVVFLKVDVDEAEVSLKELLLSHLFVKSLSQGHMGARPRHVTVVSVRSSVTLSSRDTNIPVSLC